MRIGVVVGSFFGFDCGFKVLVIPQGTSRRVGYILRNCRREATYKSFGCRLYRGAKPKCANVQSMNDECVNPDATALTQRSGSLIRIFDV